MTKHIILLLMLICCIGWVEGTTPVIQSPVYSDQDLIGYVNSSENITSYAWYVNGVQVENNPRNNNLFVCSFDNDLNCSNSYVWSKSGNSVIGSDTGKFGGSANFDGNDDYIRIGNNSFANSSSGNFTLSLWFMFNTTNTSSNALFFQNYVTGGTNGFSFYLDNGQMVVGAKNESANTNTYHAATLEWLPKEWYWVAITYTNSTTSSNLRFYRNGILINNGNLSNAKILPSIQNAFIGGFGTGSLNGTIDDIIMEDRFYSDEELERKYMAATARNERNTNFLSKASYKNGDSIIYSVYNSTGWTNSTTAIIIDRKISVQVNYSRALLQKTVLQYSLNVWNPWFMINDSNFRGRLQEFNLDKVDIQLGKCSGSTCYPASFEAIGYDVPENYTLLDNWINASMTLNLTPYFHNFGANNYEWGYTADTTDCDNITAYGLAYANVINHYYNVATNGSWLSQFGYNLDFNNMEFSVANEPEKVCYWGNDNNYTLLINTTLKNITSGKFGGDTVFVYNHSTTYLNYSVWFDHLANMLHQNFTSIHNYVTQYVYTLLPYSQSNQRNNFKYDYPIPPYHLFNWSYTNYFLTPPFVRQALSDRGYASNHPIYYTEFNQHVIESDIVEKYNPTFFATGLYYLMTCGNVSRVTPYRGMNHHSSSKQNFDLISEESNDFPLTAIGETYKEFIHCFPNGTTLYSTTVNDSNIISIWGTRPDGTDCGMIVNQRDGTVNVTLNFTSSLNTITRLNDSSTIRGSNGNFNVQLSNFEAGMYEIDDCVTPYENITLTTSTTFCPGTYYLNDTEGDGSIKIGGSNLNISCSGAKLQGNFAIGSQFINFGNYQNITITNCVFDGYAGDIQLNGNITISNSLINHYGNISSKYSNVISNTNITFYTNQDNSNGITHGKSGAGDFNVSNSRIMSNSSNYGFFFVSHIDSTRLKIEDTYIFGLGNLTKNENSLGSQIVEGGNFIFRHNIVNNSRGITTNSKEANNINYSIENNEFYNSIYPILLTRFNGTGSTYRIANNLINTSLYGRFNGASALSIYFEDVENGISENNTIFLYNLAKGIDLKGITNVPKGSKNNIIRSNKHYSYGYSWGILLAGCVYNTLVEYNYQEGELNNTGISLGSPLGQGVFNNIIQNNTINITMSITNPDKGYAFSLTTNSSNNSVSNNQIYNAPTGIRVFSNSYGNNFSQNTFQNVERDYFIGSSESISIIDGDYNDGIAKFMIDRDNLSFIVNETSSLYHLINLSNNGWIKFYGNNRKDFTIINNSLQVHNMPTDYNQFFYSNQSTPIIENIKEYNITVEPGNRTLVFTFESSDQPVFDSVGTGINDIIYSYENNILTINCTGTGSIGLTNMTLLLERFGINYDYYVHKQDGVLVDYTKGDTYTMTSCSSHTFYGENPKLSYTSPQAYNILTDVLAVILAVALLIFAAAPVIGNPNWDMKQYINYYIFVLIATILISVLIQYIFDA